MVYKINKVSPIKQISPLVGQDVWTDLQLFVENEIISKELCHIINEHVEARMTKEKIVRWKH